jgi:hypothetical protein
MKKVQVNRTKYGWKIGVGIVFAVLFVGCKTTLNTASSSAEITKTEESFFTSVLDNALRFNTLSARMNLDFSSLQQEFSSRVQVKMVYDDRIQLSLQPVLGIEVFRIELSNDSIKILDRLNKRYVSDNYNQLKNELAINFNFQNLQALLTNRIFIPGERQISKNHFRQFRVSKNSHTAEFQWKDRSGAYYTFLADGEEKLLSTSFEDETQKFTFEYSRFQTVNNQLFPMRMTARLTSGDDIHGTVVFAFSTPEINSPLTLDFTVPSGFNRVALEQLINSFRMK